jgi:hypothetical protein
MLSTGFHYQAWVIVNSLNLLSLILFFSLLFFGIKENEILFILSFINILSFLLISLDVYVRIRLVRQLSEYVIILGGENATNFGYSSICFNSIVC